MKVDKDVIARLAHLSRLELDEKAQEDMIADMNKILAFVEKLAELDTENVEPLVYMNSETNKLRTDEVKTTITQAEALKNAPQKDTDYIKVPKVLRK